MVTQQNISADQVWKILNGVNDPEIPVLSIVDLGIVRDVRIVALPSLTAFPPNMKQEIEVIITPTYSGCPAMDVIAATIRFALLQNGCKEIKIRQQLSPAWTTDWISEKGKDRLKSYGIAPPVEKRHEHACHTDEVECPLCLSRNTRLLSQFGSTACKALYQCNECKEPFDYFKCH